MTHLVPHELSPNATSLSFVAFERSIKAGPGSPRNRSKLLVQT
jgi:hypothetical protein